MIKTKQFPCTNVALMIQMILILKHTNVVVSMTYFVWLKTHLTYFNVSVYIAMNPVVGDCWKCSTFHPWHTCSFQRQLDFSGMHSAINARKLFIYTDHHSL